MDRTIPFYMNTDFGDINAFNLVLGTDCNMGCRHCSQRPVRKASDGVAEIDSKVFRLLRNFIAYSHDTASARRKPNQIVFWGGEPLLYWDTAKDLLLRLAKETGLKSGDGFVFSMTTNGLLLTEDKVDFINAHGMKVGISYEAPYPFAVRGYVPDTACAFADRIDNLSVTANCGTRYNCDPLLAYRCLVRKFPHAKSYDIYERLYCTFGMPADIYGYDWSEVSDNYRKLRIAAQLGDGFAMDKLLGYFRKMGDSWHVIDDIPPRERILRCPFCGTEFAVTLDGKVSFCSNGDLFFSTVADAFDDITERNARYGKSIVSAGCDACRHNDICWKQCSLSMRDAQGGFLMCDRQLLPLYDIIKGQLLELSEPLAESDREWYAGQEELMASRVEAFLLEGERYKREGTGMPKDA